MMDKMKSDLKEPGSEAHAQSAASQPTCPVIWTERNSISWKLLAQAAA